MKGWWRLQLISVAGNCSTISILGFAWIAQAKCFSMQGLYVRHKTSWHERIIWLHCSPSWTQTPLSCTVLCISLFLFIQMFYRMALMTILNTLAVFFFLPWKIAPLLFSFASFYPEPCCRFCSFKREVQQSIIQYINITKVFVPLLWQVLGQFTPECCIHT